MTSINSNSYLNPAAPAALNRQEKLAAASQNAPEANVPQTAANTQQRIEDRVEIQQETRRTQVNPADKGSDFQRAAARHQGNQAERARMQENLESRQASAEKITEPPSRLKSKLKSEMAPNPLEAQRQAQYSPDARAASARAELTANDLPVSQSELMDYTTGRQAAQRQERESQAQAAYEKAQADGQRAAEIKADARDRYVQTRTDSPALRELSSGVSVDAATSVQEEARALNTDNRSLAEINKRMADIDAQVQTISTASRDTLRAPANAETNQRTVDQALDKTNAAAERARAQINDSKGIGAGDLSELNSVLDDLGDTPDPANGENLTLRDLYRGGRAEQAGNAELAARVSDNASKQVSAMRNTVETLEGNLNSAAAANRAGALRDIDRTAAEMAVTRPQAESSLRTVMSALDNAPADAIFAGSNRLNPSTAEALLAE